MTTSATPCNKVPPEAAPPADVPAATDSIPRIRIRDLILVQRAFADQPVLTLEELRLKVSLDRGGPVHRLSHYSVARDVAGELARQGYAEVGPLPKASRDFEKKRDVKIKATAAGSEMAQLIRSKGTRREAFQRLLGTTYASHPYFRRFVAALADGPLLAPTITSSERHISERYASARVLMDDIANKRFDSDALLGCVVQRLKRPLTAAERAEIAAGASRLVSEPLDPAKVETQTEFARKLLSRLNEIVVPAVLRDAGLGFDFNTLRRLWKFAEEFQLGWATSAHPRYDGWLFFNTAQIEFRDPDAIRLSFPSSLAELRSDFLDRAYAVYLQMQEWGASSFVPAWEFRAAFCLEHRCAPGVFDALFAEHYNGSGQYTVEKEFLRTPLYEDPLVLGGRQIGLLRMTK